MTNINVYLRKLHLPEKYLDEPKIALLLSKPGTLSKMEKMWLKAYVAILELRDVKPSIERNKLSEEFKRSIKKK